MESAHRRLIFMATKEFLRKLRQKHHLGEYSRKAVKRPVGIARPKRAKKKTGGFHMAKKHYSRKARSMNLGILGVAYKGALMGIGAATAVNTLTSGEKIPFQSELAGGIAGLTSAKGTKNRIVGAVAGAGATMAIKHLPNMLKGINNASGPNMNGANMN
jgi:hypothetical protein